MGIYFFEESLNGKTAGIKYGKGQKVSPRGKCQAVFVVEKSKKASFVKNVLYLGFRVAVEKSLDFLARI